MGARGSGAPCDGPCWPRAGRACSLVTVKRFAIALCVVAGCGGDDDGEELRQGGAATVDDRTIAAFTYPIASVEENQGREFAMGRSTFNFVWPIPVLGPLFNNDSCRACHDRNGRGLSQIGNG